MFFESKKPVKRKWGSWLSGFAVTSDQLLEMLFGLGALQPSHCQMMSVILGLIQTDKSAHSLPQPTDESSKQLAQALNAVGLAGHLGVNLLVDS